MFINCRSFPNSVQNRLLSVAIKLSDILGEKLKVGVVLITMDDASSRSKVRVSLCYSVTANDKTRVTKNTNLLKITETKLNRSIVNVDMS